MLSGLISLFVLCLIGGGDITLNNSRNVAQAEAMLNEKIYSNMFIRRREEQKTLLRHFLTANSYEQSFKMLFIGLQKILVVLEESREKLREENYFPHKGFPKEEEQIESVAHILENTCLFAELYLHLPDMASLVIEHMKGWDIMMNWALEFCNHFPDIIDVKSQQLLEILDMEVNPKKRPANYKNPYFTEETKPANVKQIEKKPKKKPKKGPKLTGRVEL